MNELKLVAITSSIISTYINESYPLEPKTYVTKTISISDINRMMAYLLDMFGYSFFFSTEKDYLDAILSLRIPTSNLEYIDYRDQALEVLVQASKSVHFRSYDKEIIANAIITKIFHEERQMDVMDEIYRNLKI